MSRRIASAVAAAPHAFPKLDPQPDGFNSNPFFFRHSCVLSLTCIFTIKKIDCPDRHMARQNSGVVTDRKK
jgi:hypothetical protein